MNEIQLLQNSFPVVIEQAALRGKDEKIKKAEWSNRNIFSIVTTNYKVIRHEEAIEFIDDELEVRIEKWLD